MAPNGEVGRLHALGQNHHQAGRHRLQRSHAKRFIQVPSVEVERGEEVGDGLGFTGVARPDPVETHPETLLGLLDVPPTPARVRERSALGGRAAGQVDQR